MLRFSSASIYPLIGVGFVIGAFAIYATHARAQDAGTASVAELQQRVQDLEGIVRQMKDRAPMATADPSAATATRGDGNQFVPAAPNAAVGNNALANNAAGNNAAGNRAGGERAGGNQGTTTDKNFSGWNNGFFLESPDQTCQLRIPGSGRYVRLECGGGRFHGKSR
jgi:hypothetical protein